MRFHIHSPYLCEAFHIMATDSPPRPHSTDWGSTLYLKLYRRLLRGGVRPFKVHLRDPTYIESFLSILSRCIIHRYCRGASLTDALVD